MKLKTLLLILCLLFTSCATPQTLWRPPPQCLPAFPDKDGWYGGDGAYSIALDDQRTLWLFGDTFASTGTEKTNRAGMDIISGNTLAISTCDPVHGFDIRYYLKKRQSRFISFFGEDAVLWPQAPFIVNNTLYIPLLVVEFLAEASPPFNFRISGHRVARIDHFDSDDPRKWHVDDIDWSGAIPPGIEALATTSAVYGGFVYFYPLYRAGTKTGNILARLSTASLDTPEGALEYLHEDGNWHNRIDSETVKILFSEGLSELSVRYVPENAYWLAVYLDPQNKGSRILFRKAPHLAGPWSAPETLLDPVAEVDPESPRYHQKTFCYAGKEHARFSSAQSLIVTYVCNSSEDPTDPDSFIARHLFLYRPVVKQVPAP